MASAKQKLSKIIREIVQQEVEKTLTEIFGDRKNKRTPRQAQEDIIEKFNEHEKVSYTSNLSLNEALNATANDDGFRTMKNFNSSDVRSKFMQMQGGAPSIENMVPQDLAHKPIDKSVEKALTRDYTELVKRFKK